MDDTNIICLVYNAISAIQVPLAIISIIFIGIAKIGSPFLPEAAQRYGRMLRDVIMGLVIILASTWIVGLLFQDAALDCPKN